MKILNIRIKVWLALVGLSRICFSTDLKHASFSSEGVGALQTLVLFLHGKTDISWIFPCGCLNSGLLYLGSSCIMSSFLQMNVQTSMTSL